MRTIVALLCVVLAPVVARAQTPSLVPGPAAAASLARLSGRSTRPLWAIPASLDSAVAADTKKKNDKKTLGAALMIVGIGAIVGGAIYGGDGGLAIMIGGGILEGYGYTLYHGGR